MIVRYYVTCNTCDASHMLRIGLGQEHAQTHSFNCRNCAEPITVKLNLKPVDGPAGLACIENCKLGDQRSDSYVVNLDPNFVIPEDQQGDALAFPRLVQMVKMTKIAEQQGSLINLSQIPEALRGFRPYRGPDYHEEWKKLHKGWSLYRNDKLKLSGRILDEVSKSYYGNDPLNDMEDWVWRFLFYSANLEYWPRVEGILNSIKPLYKNSSMKDFSEAYQKNIPARGARYFGIIRDFFSVYSEFGQVYFSVLKGMEMPSDYRASSTDFNAVRMFYEMHMRHLPARSIFWQCLIICCWVGLSTSLKR